MNKQAKAPTYKVDDHSVQRCQSCDGTQWILGRNLAECANCNDVYALQMRGEFTIHKGMNDDR